MSARLKELARRKVLFHARMEPSVSQAKMCRPLRAGAGGAVVRDWFRGGAFQAFAVALCRAARGVFAPQSLLKRPSTLLPGIKRGFGNASAGQSLLSRNLNAVKNKGLGRRMFKPVTPKLLSDWLRECASNRHFLLFQSRAQRGFVHPQLVRPLLERLRPAFVGKQAIASFVVVLGLQINPAAVFGAVMSVAVDPVDLKAVGVWPHVSYEVVEFVSPALADFDSAQSVKLVALRGGAITAVQHIAPALIQRVATFNHNDSPGRCINDIVPHYRAEVYYCL